MPDYKCHKCEKVFKQKGHLRNHYNRKIPCDSPSHMIVPPIPQNHTIINTIIPQKVINNNKCDYCDKIFSRKDVAVKHMKNHCKVVKQLNKENEEQNDTDERLKLLELEIERLKFLELENDRMKKEIMELKNINQPIINQKKGVIGNNNTINNTNNTNNTTNNNIIIVACGKEDMSKINKKDILKALNTGFMSPVSLIEKTHFNDEHPEYHNIFIPDLKNAHAQVHDGTRWVKKNTNDVIDELYDKNIAYIGYALDNEKEMIDKLKQSKRNALNELILIDADHDEFGVIKRRKTDMRYLLHNKKYIPLNTMQ
jgi:hypothetical protein